MARGSNTARSASAEEEQCWAGTAASLRQLNRVYSSAITVDTLERVNRLISAWPTDDTPPAEGLDGLRTLYNRLSAGLAEIQKHADEETKAIEDVIERLGVVVALRKASESIPPAPPRNKRPRGHSPSGTPALPGSTGATPPPLLTKTGVSITLPPRQSSVLTFTRDPKLQRESFAPQLPLREGRAVAFHPNPNQNQKPGEEGNTDENTWILAVIKRCINQDKNRYEVQDAEPQEDGQPGASFNTTLRSIMPLPDDKVPPENPAHLNNYPECPPGSKVLALYPDTSCFYRAEVLAAPRQTKMTGPKQAATYKVAFEDDENQEHTILAKWIVPFPSETGFVKDPSR